MKDKTVTSDRPIKVRSAEAAGCIRSLQSMEGELAACGRKKQDGSGRG
jgi:hypothetical protein